MKIIISIIISLIFFLSVSAQTKTVKLDPNTKKCGWNKPFDQDEIRAWDEDPDDAARELVKRICQIAVLEENFIIKKAVIDNAMATIDEKHNGRVIYYSEEFFKSIDNEWFRMAVLAHEIGHHLNNHTFTKLDKRQADELTADEFAGSILYKMGAPLADIRLLINEHCSTQGSEFYPPKSSRLEAVERGYKKAGYRDISNTDLEKKLGNYDISGYYLKKHLYANEYDGKSTKTLIGGIEAYKESNGMLWLGRNRTQSTSIEALKGLDNYEIDFEVAFNYEETDQKSKFVDKQQYLIWLGKRSSDVIKGYYISPYRIDGENILEIGYMDGESFTELSQVKLRDDKLCFGGFKKFRIRKYKEWVRIFIDSRYEDILIVNDDSHYSHYILLNQMPFAANRYSEVYVEQLDFGGTINLNYFRISSISPN